MGKEYHYVISCCIHRSKLIENIEQVNTISVILVGILHVQVKFRN